MDLKVKGSSHFDDLSYGHVLVASTEPFLDKVG
jgi:hypothetical protein